MNKAAFVCFGTFVTVFRCLLASVTIVQSVMVMDMKNHLISPLRDWLSNLIFYSIFPSLFVILVTAIDSMDYAEKNIHQFKKIESSKQSLKLKSYVTVTAVEAVVLICYCANLQFTLQTISEEVKNTLTTSLSKYATNRSWRLFWNQIQQKYYCCGSTQNTDWFQTAWISPTAVTSFSLLKKYTQQNGKFIIPAAPISCCLPNAICITFTDCEQPDPEKYYQNSCSSIIANQINSIAYTRYSFYAVLVIQIISAVVKYEGYIENNHNTKL